MVPTEHAGGVLTVDLDALAANYRLLAGRLGAAECAAAVKADAYGLGVARVAPALARAGCRLFFVATLDEAVALRAILPEAGIVVLAGVMAGEADTLVRHRVVPALNDLGQIARWADHARARGQAPLDAVIHVDTGMCRLGLPPAEVDILAAEPERLRGLRLVLAMSHLARADEADNPMNPAQRDAFAAAIRRLPAARASLANSSGIFLGPGYHFDLARPGVALHGVNPTPGSPNPMVEVVHLKGKILQLRDVDSPQTVGYGATHRVTAPGRLATVAVGYADGYPRSLSSRGHVAVGGVKVPVVGRVSMDLITIDVSTLDAGAVSAGDWVTLIGGDCPIDAVAEDAGTIAYELLTRLGRRYARRYVESDASTVIDGR